ncbi:hypothetical protein NR798_00330 [Archangium gephyra]|uniref:hypothetical protein n=1 Tax=Archangium gephyra TaxID=48 RepID=UPI0035D521D3
MSQRAMLAAVMGFLMLGTGCPHTYRKGGKLDRAMQQDMKDKFKQRGEEFRNQELEDDEDEDEERICPDDKVEYRDCRTLPCTVTCQ